MKNFLTIFICAGLVAGLMVSCKDKRSPGRVYMPDMAYSRAYETYSGNEALQKKGINYTSMPVPGTIARGDFLQIYNLPNDSAGYKASASVKNPIPADSIDMVEAERLYMVNCAICHGAKLDGNGPIYNGGNGPYPAAPRNFLLPELKAMGDGTYFHAMTYGRGQMGSYASQMNTVERWMVVAYIRTKQGGGAAGADSTMNKPATDTTAARTGN
jgi:mono/diheme cytochrome c family protein